MRMLASLNEFSPGPANFVGASPKSRSFVVPYVCSQIVENLRSPVVCRFKRVDLFCTPKACIVYLSLLTPVIRCKDTVDQIMMALTRSLRQKRVVSLSEPVCLYHGEQEGGKIAIRFKISRVYGTFFSKVDTDLDVFMCDPGTRFILCDMVGCKSVWHTEVCCRHGLFRRLLHTNKMSSTDFPVFVHQRGILNCTHGSVPTYISHHELVLLEDVVKAYPTIRHFVAGYNLLHEPKSIVVHSSNNVASLTETFVRDGVRHESSTSNVHDIQGYMVCSPQFNHFARHFQASALPSNYLKTHLTPEMHVTIRPSRNLSVSDKCPSKYENYLEHQKKVLSSSFVRLLDESAKLPVAWRRTSYHELAEIVLAESSRGYRLSRRAGKESKFCWADIGGHSRVKNILVDIFNFSLKHRHLVHTCRSRKRNILLFGPPGTGKTLLAKVVAQEIDVSFISIKGPELLNVYVGESERAIRTLFQEAVRKQPCLIFFDEVESIASDRVHGSTMLGRVASQILLEFDTLKSQENVFVMGASNRPDMLDRSLLRPGRFDYLLYMGIDASIQRRINLLRAVTRRITLAEEVNLARVATLCEPMCSGADIYSMCVRAWIRAAIRLSLRYDGLMSQGVDHVTNVCVSQEDMTMCAISTVPSIRSQDIHKYEELRAQYDSTHGDIDE